MAAAQSDAARKRAEAASATEQAKELQAQLQVGIGCARAGNERASAPAMKMPQEVCVLAPTGRDGGRAPPPSRLVTRGKMLQWVCLSREHHLAVPQEMRARADAAETAAEGHRSAVEAACVRADVAEAAAEGLRAALDQVR